MNAVKDGARISHSLRRRAEKSMTHPASRRRSLTAQLGGSTARWAIATALFGAGTLSCSDDAPTSTTTGQPGTTGQITGGSTTGDVVTTGMGSSVSSVTSGVGGSASNDSGTVGAGGSVANGVGGSVAGSVGGSVTVGAGGSVAGGSGSGGTAGLEGSGGAAGGAGGAGGSGGSGGDGEGWTDLFNGTNLDGWTPSPGAADLFGVGEVDGSPVIHVYPTQADQSNQPEATLRTNESYSSYVFHLEYKWGVNRFGARSQTDRDNGICFHVCNDPTQVWPESIELQIGSQAWPGDWVTGNIFMLINKTRAQWPYAMENGQEVFSENGTRQSIGAPTSYYKGLTPSPNLDIADDWNVIELTVRGAAEAEYKVNGTVVNRLFDMECDEGSGFQPLVEGPIALQAEYAEIYFRNVRIQVLQ